MKPELGGIILSGGEGRRFGGRNKGLIELHGRPFIQHILEKLQPHLDMILISANRDMERYRSFGYPVCPDQDEWQGLGPLAGLASCFSLLPDHLDAVLVVPCDTPLLPDDLIPALAEKLFEKPENQIAYAVSEESIHPSIFLARFALFADLPGHLAEGKRSLKSWIFRYETVAFFFEDANAFTNINDDTILKGLCP